MSKLLKEVLKSAIFPTAVLISGKAIALYLALLFYGQTVVVMHENGRFYSVQLVVANGDFAQRVNTLADSLLLIFILSIYGYIAIRYYIYVKSSGNPRTIIRLVKLNLLNWITDRNNALIKFVIWSVYGVLIGSVVLINAVAGYTARYMGIAGMAAVVSIIVILVRVLEDRFREAFFQTS